MKRDLMILSAFILILKIAAGERRQWDKRLARPRSYLFKPNKIHKSHAEHKQVSLSLFHENQALSALKLRGGGVVEKFSTYIADSRARSWVVLLIAILLDTCSSTIMKIGRDEGSIMKLATAYAGFFTRYVKQRWNQI